MRIIGNILWLILGGLLVSLGYFIAGLLYCVTTIGIPIGMAVIVFSIAITGLYVRRANSEFDALTREIIEEATQ